MGYLTKLYFLFPEFGSSEECAVNEGMKTIESVFEEHLSNMALSGFEEYEEELYSFRDIVRRNIEAAFEYGLKKTRAVRKISRSDIDYWESLSIQHKDSYLSFFDGLITEFLQNEGHYPLSPSDDTMYYNIDGGLNRENIAQLVAKVYRTDYESGFVDIDYNVRLFKERVLSYLSADTNKYLNLNNLKSFIQDLFSDYIARLGDERELSFVLDSGLCWIYFTKQYVFNVVQERLLGVYSHEDLQVLSVVFVEMRNIFTKSIQQKMSPIKVFRFKGLVDNDFKRAYEYIVRSVKQKTPEFSRFTEGAFLDAMYRGNIRRIYINGVKDKLKATIKVLKPYAESGWVEAVAASVNKSVRQIDGTEGLNPGGFADTHPLHKKKEGSSI